MEAAIGLSSLIAAPPAPACESFTLINCVKPASTGISTAIITPAIEAAAKASVRRFHGCAPISTPKKLFR